MYYNEDEVMELIVGSGCGAGSGRCRGSSLDNTIDCLAHGSLANPQVLEDEQRDERCR